MNKLFGYDSKLMQLMNKFADLMLLNVLTLICCIPIITIGPALTAMHYVLLKIYRDNGGYIIKNFFKSFKENFVQSMILGVIYTAIVAVLVVDLLFVRQNAVNLLLEIVVIVAIVLSAFSFVWIFPLQSRYGNPIRTTIKNSFMVGALNFGKSIMMILIASLPIWLFMFTTAALPIFTMFGLTVPAYIQTMLYSVVFDKMEGVDHSAEAEREDDGWTVELEDESNIPIAAESMQDVLASWEKNNTLESMETMTKSEENDTILGQNDEENKK